MSNFRIIYTRPEDGGVSVVIPAPDATVEDCVSRLPAGVTHEVVGVDDIPSDRTFRNAWEHDTTPKPRKIAVNLPKAKELTHERRRAKRAAEFAPLDVEATIPAKAAQAEAARQAIRDKYTVIQNNIDAATTPELLKAVIDENSL